MGNRERIVRTVQEQPGIGFAQLRRETECATGVVQHHLNASDAVERVNDAIVPAGYCDHCPLQGRCEDRCRRKPLSDPVKRKILSKLADGDSQAEIARALDRDRSTITYHVQRLTGLSLVSGGEPVDGVRRLLD